MVFGSLTAPSSADSLTAAGAVGFRTKSGFGSLATRPSIPGSAVYRVRTRAPSLKENRVASAEPLPAQVSCAYDFSILPKQWMCLDEKVRSEVSDQTQAAVEWSEIVIHATGFAAKHSRYLNAMRQVVLGIDGNQTYHFLIGEEPSHGEGIIFSGRLDHQSDPSIKDRRNIHVCVSGDFDHSTISESQLRALHELVLFLRARVGQIPVTLHGGSGGCLGRLFPDKTVLGGLNEGLPGWAGVEQRDKDAQDQIVLR
mgnify:CR=1 FL=1